MNRTQDTRERARDLQASAERLLSSSLFCGVTDAYPLVEKQQLFLAIAGCKPLSEAVSGHWVLTEDGRRTVPDDSDAVSELLDALGLTYTLQADEHGLTAVVAKEPHLLTEYAKAEAAGDAGTIGRLFGYPESAVDAFLSGETLDGEEQDAIELDAGLTSFASFVFSRSNWPDELDLVLSWQRVLDRYQLR